MIKEKFSCINFGFGIWLRDVAIMAQSAMNLLSDIIGKKLRYFEYFVKSVYVIIFDYTICGTSNYNVNWPIERNEWFYFRNLENKLVFNI